MGEPAMSTDPHKQYREQFASAMAAGQVVVVRWVNRAGAEVEDRGHVHALALGCIVLRRGPAEGNVTIPLRAITRATSETVETEPEGEETMTEAEDTTNGGPEKTAPWALSKADREAFERYAPVLREAARLQKRCYIEYRSERALAATSAIPVLITGVFCLVARSPGSTSRVNIAAIERLEMTEPPPKVFRCPDCHKRWSPKRKGERAEEPKP
jgi:hypothetical protein